MKKIGFCKQCLRNVPHVLFFRWPILRLLHRNPEFANSLPLGSWHCCGCERNTFRLKRPDSEVATDVTSTTMDDIIPWPDRNDPTQRFGLLFRRKRKTKVLEPSQAELEQAEADTAFEHVGNVTRSDDSLLVRKARAARFSKKFRDGVVDRVLSGKSTITQIRNELKLSERDVLDWINDRVMRQDQRIAKLTQVVDAVQELTSEAVAKTPSKGTTRLRIDNASWSSEEVEEPHYEPIRPDGITIDGQIKRD